MVEKKKIWRGEKLTRNARNNGNKVKKKWYNRAYKIFLRWNPVYKSPLEIIFAQILMESTGNWILKKYWLEKNWLNPFLGIPIGNWMKKPGGINKNSPGTLGKNVNNLGPN